MKIVLINSLYKPYSRGGAEVVFCNIVKALKKIGHDVCVITITDDSAKTNYCVSEMDDISVYRFYPKNIFSFVDINNQPFWKRVIWHLIDTFNVHSYYQVKKILKSVNPDLVLSHNLKGLGYLTLIAVRRLKIKNIHTLHDVQLVNPSGLIIKGREKQSILCHIYAKISKILFNCPDVVVAPSRWLWDFYHRYGFFRKSREEIIPNPIILETENYKKSFTEPTINYLFLGQLEEHKGILLLLDVFADFAQKHEVKLFIVGKGKLDNFLNQKYGGQTWLEFMGYVPFKDLSQKVFKRIHYTILPSLCYENSPSVIYDSFNYATPVIAASIGGVSELVDEGVNGYLFEPGNKISLLNKLNFSLQHPENFTQMAENAKIKAKEYDIRNYIYRILSL